MRNFVCMPDSLGESSIVLIAKILFWKLEDAPPKVTQDKLLVMNINSSANLIKNKSNLPRYLFN